MLYVESRKKATFCSTESTHQCEGRKCTTSSAYRFKSVKSCANSCYYEYREHKKFFDEHSGMVRSKHLQEAIILYCQLQKLIEQGYVEKVRYGYNLCIIYYIEAGMPPHVKAIK